MPEQEKLIPSQIAREAAADLIERTYSHEKGKQRLAEMTRGGYADSTLFAQSFARFEQLILARPGNAEGLAVALADVKIDGKSIRHLLAAGLRSEHRGDMYSAYGAADTVIDKAADMLAALHTSGLVAAESEEGLASKINWLGLLLEGRDKFIVEHDLWGKFVESLPSRQQMTDMLATTSPNASVTPEPADLAGRAKEWLREFGDMADGKGSRVASIVRDMLAALSVIDDIEDMRDKLTKATEALLTIELISTNIGAEFENDAWRWGQRMGDTARQTLADIEKDASQ